MTKETILVVDDEQNIIELARLYLEQDGYRVEQANTGRQALDKIRQIDPALMILDLMLPEIDGWEVCRRVRANSDLPIIMLTARDDDVDKIVGLELGADDYLTKPFNPRELVARVKAILRRSERAASPTKVIRIGDLTIDPARREVTVAGQPIDLRAKEFDCLLTLAENKGIVLSREKLLELAWGYDFAGQTRTVDVHVAHLRKKINHSTAQIETVTGVGYKLINNDQ
jgi:two-component system, OmpR family, alkaline phosphatase synthesis response regulator PhoP